MSSFKKNLANYITSSRIALAAVVGMLQVENPIFIYVYGLCGLTDAIDGFVARTLKTVSEFGSKLDSIADVIFYSVMILKMFPYFIESFSWYTWGMLYIYLTVRLYLYLDTAVHKNTLLSNHTYLNKLSGFVAFLVPFMRLTPYFNVYCNTIALINLTAAGQELTWNLKEKISNKKK